MRRIGFKHITLRPANRFRGLARAGPLLLFGLFLLAGLVACARVWKPDLVFGNARWPEGLLVVLTAGATLASLGRQLPGQNALAAALLVTLMAGGVQCLGVLTGIPFGPYTFTERVGQQLFYPLPWAVPLIWLVILLNARGVARLVLRPWRHRRNYGFRLLGLSVLLVMLMDLGFEPFATIVKEYWTWKPTLVPSDWYGTPWVNFLGWAVSALVILAFATPFLINKQPGNHPPQFQPLAVWGVLNLLFLTGAVAHRLTLATILILTQSVIVAALALACSRRRAPT